MKPLSRTEMKILIYNKVRSGMTYDEARRQVSSEIAQLRATVAKSKASSKESKPDFKQAFDELVRSKR